MTDVNQPKQEKQPRWWIPITFGILLTWLVNNLITILAFVGTGVVNLSHTGIGPFLVALVLSVVCGAVGVVLGIRFSVYVALSAIAAFYRTAKSFAKHGLSSQASGSESAKQTQPATPSVPVSPETPTRWTTLRDKAGEMYATILVWLFVPKSFRKKLGL